jgi:hypothetical protein
MPLASPASAILISLLLGGSPMIPLSGLPHSWVAIVTSSLVIVPRRSCVHSVVALPSLLQTSRDAESAVPWSIRCQESNASFRLSLTFVVAELFRRFCFRFFAKPFLITNNAACGWWQVAYVGRNYDVSRYGSLNLIFSAATMTRSHAASRSWC